MTRMLVCAFESVLQAREALTTAEQLQERGMLRLRTAVFVRKDADGGPFASETRHPGSSAFAGVIAVLFARELGALIAPGDCALVLLVADIVDGALEAFGVRVIEAAPPDAAVAA